MAVSLICWALWPCGYQSDTCMLGFVDCAAVSLICWALWPCGCQSDIYVGLCGRAAVSLICWLCGCQSDRLGFVGCAAVSLIHVCWAVWLVSLICWNGYTVHITTFISIRSTNEEWVKNCIVFLTRVMIMSDC